jgi:hypothetical protein
MSAPSPMLRRSLIENRAKLAYSIFASHTARQEPYEHLTNGEQSGWMEVVRFLCDEDPECRCGEGLACIHCDAAFFYDEMGDALAAAGKFRLKKKLDAWIAGLIR